MAIQFRRYETIKSLDKYKRCVGVVQDVRCRDLYLNHERNC